MNVSSELKLDTDLDSENVRKLTATIVYLSLMLAVGVPGNLTVLVIYGRKYAKSVYRSIIWNLAIADLTFCGIGLPFHIARVVHYFSFTSLWTCKIFTFLLVVGIMYSTHLLMLLSLHRFRQTCMPLRSQISLKNIKFFIIGCFVISFILSLPQFILEEIEVQMVRPNITGSICPITPSVPSVYWMINNYFFLCLFAVYTMTLLVSYTLIGHRIYIHRKKATTYAVDGSKRGEMLSRKMTKIAFTISMVFALSYIPLFVLRVVKVDIEESDLGSVTFSIFKIVERSYIINHVANPFVYAIFDNRFREQFKRMFSFKRRCGGSEDFDSNTRSTSLNLDRI